MSSDIIIEVDAFLRAIALGAVCGLIYDILRIFRRLRTRGMVLTGIEDLLYWSASAVALFIFLYKENGGVIRAYIIMAMTAGMFLYEIALGQFIVKYLTILCKKIFGKFFEILSLLLKKCFKPFKIPIRKLKKLNDERKMKRIHKRREKLSDDSKIKRGAEIENRTNKKKEKKKK